MSTSPDDFPPDPVIEPRRNTKLMVVLSVVVALVLAGGTVAVASALRTHNPPPIIHRSGALKGQQYQSGQAVDLDDIATQKVIGARVCVVKGETGTTHIGVLLEVPSDELNDGDVVILKLLNTEKTEVLMWLWSFKHRNRLGGKPYVVYAGNCPAI